MSSSLVKTVAQGLDEVGPAALPALQQQVRQIIDEAARQGATACEVAASSGQGLSVGVRNGEVETLEFNRDQGFGITLYVGHRKGSASTSATGEGAIRQTVAAALAIAQHTAQDPYAGLADASLMADPNQLPELDIYHPWEIDPEQAIARALQVERAALAVQPEQLRPLGTGLSSHRGCRVYGNSHGFVAGAVGSRHSLSCSMLAEGKGQMQRDYWYDVQRDANLLARAEDIGEQAARRALARLGARAVPTCEAPVLFCAELAGGLFGHFIAAISGGNLYRQSSFLLDCLGQQLFPRWLSLNEQPHIPGALGSAAFDGDGLATYAKPFVGDGELVSYALSSYAGRRLGLPSTANADGVHNLLVTHGDEDQAALIRRMDRGLLVTELMGQGVNLVTGDYSRGAAGYWVERGEIQFPVQEVTIAANLRNLFANLVAVGNDIEWRGNVRSGSVLVEKMTIAGS